MVAPFLVALLLLCWYVAGRGFAPPRCVPLPSPFAVLVCRQEWR